MHTPNFIIRLQRLYQGKGCDGSSTLQRALRQEFSGLFASLGLCGDGPLHFVFNRGIQLPAEAGCNFVP